MAMQIPQWRYSTSPNDLRRGMMDVNAPLRVANAEASAANAHARTWDTANKLVTDYAKFVMAEQASDQYNSLYQEASTKMEGFYSDFLDSNPYEMVEDENGEIIRKITFEGIRDRFEELVGDYAKRKQDELTFPAAQEAWNKSFTPLVDKYRLKVAKEARKRGNEYLVGETYRLSEKYEDMAIGYYASGDRELGNENLAKSRAMWMQAAATGRVTPQKAEEALSDISYRVTQSEVIRRAESGEGYGSLKAYIIANEDIPGDKKAELLGNVRSSLDYQYKQEERLLKEQERQQKIIRREQEVDAWASIYDNSVPLEEKWKQIKSLRRDDKLDQGVFNAMRTEIRERIESGKDIIDDPVTRREVAIKVASGGYGVDEVLFHSSRLSTETLSEMIKAARHNESDRMKVITGSDAYKTVKSRLVAELGSGISYGSPIKRGATERAEERLLSMALRELHRKAIELVMDIGGYPEVRNLNETVLHSYFFDWMDDRLPAFTTDVSSKKRGKMSQQMPDPNPEFIREGLEESRAAVLEAVKEESIDVNEGVYQLELLKHWSFSPKANAPRNSHSPDTDDNPSYSGFGRH